MRAIILFIMIFTMAYGDVFARSINGPSHLLKPSSSPGRFTGDTIYVQYHQPNSWESSYPPGYRTRTVYKHSEDGLVDTVYIGSAHIVVYHYDEKNRVIREEDPYPPCKIWGGGCQGLDNEYWKIEYEYDEEDRLLKETWIIMGSVSGREKRIDHVDIYDYSTIIMTEKGYIFGGYEYEMDDLKRLTYAKNLNTPDGFFYGKEEYYELNGKKYRAGDTYFTYFEGGYSALGYSITSFWALGGTDKWVKTDYLFNEEGRLQHQTVYHSYDGETWEVYEKLEFFYIYASNNDDGDDPATYAGGDDNFPSENGYIAQTNTTVYASTDAIHVFAKNAATAQIFDLTGRLIKQQAVSAGENRISISANGFYIVKVGNESFKVSVR